jgi:hypothetical protein
MLAACGGHGSPNHPTPVPADAAPQGVTTAPEAAPSELECDALIEHAIDLQPTGDAALGSGDRAQLRAAVRDHVLARCRAMPRSVYRCALAATTIDAFTACEPG